MPIEIVWSSERDDGFDLRQFASGLLERAKKNLDQDGYVQSAAFLVTGKEVQCYSLAFDGFNGKQDAYDQLVTKARELNAEAIVTLNDAFIGDNRDGCDYEWGQIAKNPKGECVFVTISGPGLENCTKELQYRRGPEGIVFSAPTEESSSLIGFLGEWSRKGQMAN